MRNDPDLLAAVASPRRREILRLVWTEERSAGDIARAMPDVTFGAVSLQLRALRDAGLVDVRVEQRHRFYRAKRKALGAVGTMLERMWTDVLWSLKLAAELEASRRGPERAPSRSGNASASPSGIATPAPSPKASPTQSARTSPRRKRSPS